MTLITTLSTKTLKFIFAYKMDRIPRTLRVAHHTTNPHLLTLSRAAGTSGDGYIWKYLYTIKPSEIVKFDSIEYIPVPENWGDQGETIATKNNAIDGKIEVVVIDDRGTNYQPISTSFANVPILGDGTGGKATITVDSFGKVSEVFVTDGGEGYTHGSIQFFPG